MRNQSSFTASIQFVGNWKNGRGVRLSCRAVKYHLTMHIIGGAHLLSGRCIRAAVEFTPCAALSLTCIGRVSKLSVCEVHVG